MAGEYVGTAVPFQDKALPDLRDPVLAGPGHRALEDAIRSYDQFGRSLSDASGAVGAVLSAARGAHEGDAAEASQQVLRRLSEPGLTGARQAHLAARALEYQGDYIVRVRNDMQAADPGPTLSGSDAVAAAVASPTIAPAVAGIAIVGYVERHAAQAQAAEAADRYQGNTNHNLGAGFQAFPSPNGPTPDTSQGSAVAGGGGVGSAFRIGPAGAVGAEGGAGGGPASGSGPVVGAGAGHGTGGSAAGLVPVVPGGSTLGGAGGGAAGSGPAAAGLGGTGGARAGGTGVGGAGTGAPGPGSTGTGAAGSGGVRSGGVGPGPVGPGGAGTGSSARMPETAPSSGSVGGGVGGGIGVPGPVGLGPQAYRPGGRGPAGSDLESGILSGAPPLPGNGVISPGGASDTGRGVPAWGNAVADGRVDRAPAPLDRPTPAASGSAGRAAAAGQGGMPFMGGGGAGRASEQEHRRPSWLVQDDPDAFWFSGLPAHSDPVITPDADG